jgi:FSR family fosmidomycin resistance protein-like MFS transporter
MSYEGASFTQAGISLTLVELGAAFGAFFMGIYSDRLGNRNIAVYSTLASAVFSVGFLLTGGWLKIVLLTCIGVTAFMSNPAFLAIIQSHFPENRSMATGVYMSTSFLLRSLGVVLVGILADWVGLRTVFWGSTLATLFALPFFFTLPEN